MITVEIIETETNEKETVQLDSLERGTYLATSCITDTRLLLMIGWNASILGIDVNGQDEEWRDFSQARQTKYYDVQPVENLRFVVEI